MAEEAPELKRVVILSNKHWHKGTAYKRGSIIELPVSAADYLIGRERAIETTKPVKALVVGRQKTRR